MAAMFTMMNNARLAVGMQGVAIAEAATQAATAYASERKQGKTPLGAGAIIDHADVRRMLGQMRAETFAARAIGLACAIAIDMGRATGAPDWQARAALLTPIAKAYGTDIGNEVAYQGVQVYGGMGFIEETGVAQFSRDVRVTSIYEGTNGIQAMDLVARKMADGGEAAFRLIDEVQDAVEAARAAQPELATAVWTASEALREATEALLAQELNDRFAGATCYLRAFARVLGAQYHLQAACAEASRLPLAAFYIRRLLPEHAPAAGAGPRRGRGALCADTRGFAGVSDAIHHPWQEAPAFGQAIEIASDILWMRLPLPMALDHVNVYALADADGWTLVDTGLSSRKTKAIWQSLIDGPLAGKPIRRLIVTHHHPDHLGLAGWFQAMGVELLIPRTAWLLARMLVLDEQPLPTPESMLFYQRAGLSAAMLAAKASERPFNFADVVDPLPQGFTRLEDGGEITRGRAALADPLWPWPCPRPCHPLEP